MIRILINENIPSLNKGEMAILEGMLESFKELGATEIFMLSDHANIDNLRYGEKVKIIEYCDLSLIKGKLNNIFIGKCILSLYTMAKFLVFILLIKISNKRILRLIKSDFWKAFAASDLIIFGHNGTFGLGNTIGVPILFYPVFSPLFAKLLGKKVVIYAGTISDQKNYKLIIHKLYKIVFNHIDLITLRERISYENMIKMGYKGKNAFITADLAFLLCPSPAIRTYEILKDEGIEESCRPLIGISVTREIASKAFPKMTSEESYIKHIIMMASFVDRIIKELDATIVFIPHCVGLENNLDDRVPAQDIFLKCHRKERIKIITKEYDPQELKGLLGSFDAFIGERTHAVINAMSMCVPSINISFEDDQRIDIFRMMGQEEYICYVETLNLDHLTSKLCSILSQKHIIRSNLRSEIEVAKDKSAHNGILLKKIIFEE